MVALGKGEGTLGVPSLVAMELVVLLGPGRDVVLSLAEAGLLLRLDLGLELGEGVGVHLLQVEGRIRARWRWLLLWVRVLS